MARTEDVLIAVGILVGVGLLFYYSYNQLKQQAVQQQTQGIGTLVTGDSTPSGAYYGGGTGGTGNGTSTGAVYASNIQAQSYQITATPV